MNLLRDIITYMRRILKTPSNASITDNLLIDYINRFMIMDMPARIQLFDFKTSYKFQTSPGVDQYNMPLYELQTEGTDLEEIQLYPVYQGFVGPAYVNGITVPLNTQKDIFFSRWPNIQQINYAVEIGNGGPGPYTLQVPLLPATLPPNPPLNGLIRGHVDLRGIISTLDPQDPPLAGGMFPTLNRNIPSTSILPNVYITTIDATGATVVVQDSGQFLETNVNYGLLMVPGTAPFGYSALPSLTPGVTPAYSTTLNTINYFTGTATVLFPVSIPQGNNINVQVLYFNSGLPREILYYNNTLTLRSPPAQSYLVEIDAYLTPSAFMNTEQAIPFAYMCEYIARGAARKILSDTGDIEQFNFYEPLFREQESLVHIRSQRQWTETRTQTLYSQGNNNGQVGNNNFSGGVI